MATTKLAIVGILNCTPDSFSDGDPLQTPELACARAQRLVDEGADILDVGGDSTRPSSVCCGADEEWRRIEPILNKFAHRIPCSVDTHHVEVARRAIAAGAFCVNDISGVLDSPMFELMAAARVKFVTMFNPHGGAHVFGSGIDQGGALNSLNQWAAAAKGRFLECGGEAENLVFDSGMGAFLSVDPEVSWLVIRHYNDIRWPRGGAMFGCSRKGFLRKENEEGPRDRDSLTAICGVFVASKLSSDIPLYLRVHNVAAQRSAIERWRATVEQGSLCFRKKV